MANTTILEASLTPVLGGFVDTKAASGRRLSVSQVARAPSRPVVEGGAEEGGPSSSDTPLRSPGHA